MRDDITESFGTLSGTAAGIPLSVTLKIVAADGCAVKAGYAVYIWHCDRDGNYSMYTAPNQNYLRGATSGYEKSVTNLTQVSLSSDMVFSDGATSETPTVTGNVTDGYVATLTVGV